MDKEKIINIFKNFGYVIISNLTALVVSSIVVLILPKVIGVKEYGYWQLYTFYLTYIGFFHFGWCDGIYLKFGGRDYFTLDRKYFSSQILGFVLFQATLSLISVVSSLIFANDEHTLGIFLALSLNFVITNTRLLFVYTLQTTNRIKEASIITISDRLIYIAMLVVILFSGDVKYQYMIVADNIARFISLIYAFYICKDITFLGNRVTLQLKESWENIRVGSNLMLANIASSLIIGVVRFSIQKGWDIATFGKISLTLSLSNLVMTFINAIGIVVFPMLKRTDEAKLSSVYQGIRTVLMPVLFSMLFAYYPLKAILSIWLPAYKESLDFMGFIFPMIVFEGKTSLLLNTFLKTLRKEQLIFKSNFITTILSILLSLLTVFIFNNLNLAVFSIVLLLAFRSILLEVNLIKLLKIKCYRDLIVELVIVSIFIVSNVLFNTYVSSAIYLLTLVLYSFSIYKSGQLTNLRDLIKKKN